MKNDFLSFVEDNNKYNVNKTQFFESFKDKDIENALKLIDSILKKHIDGLVPLEGFVETLIDGNNCISKQYLVIPKKEYANASFFQINWLTSETDSHEVYSIDFFKNLNTYWDGKGKSDLSIFTLGTSIVRFLPIIWSVVNSKDYSLTQQDAEKISSQIFNNVKESHYYVGGIKYFVFENLNKRLIKNAFLIESEATEYRKEKSAEITNAEREGIDSETIKNLKSEYAKICKAIKNGAKTVEDIKMSIAKGKSVKIKTDKEISDKEEDLTKARKDPEQIFKEMGKYITLVTKGLQPSLILCGAPGVGKTFRVKKQLKANGYNEGHNMLTVKGKCTARKLYLALYEMKDKNHVLLIDDADSLVGPKADENCINILKAALDSTSDEEGRLVTYGVAGKILDDEGVEIPKKFYYKGGVIVITNYRAGQLDTALRGRSFIQDIDFTNNEVLKIIEKLLPNIEPTILDPKSKLKAFEYLQELNEKGSKMELSLRTFVLCGKIFRACDGDTDFTDEDAKSMIEEQMRLQYERGGIKY